MQQRRQAIHGPEGRQPAAGRRHSPSLQEHLVRLVALVALPLLLLAGAGVYGAYQDARQREEVRLVDQARSAARAVDLAFTGAEAMLKGLAASTSLAAGELDRFQAEIKAAAAIFGYVPISLRRDDGLTVMDSAQTPGPRDGSFRGAPDLLTAIAGAPVRIGDLQTTGDAGRPVVLVCVQVAAPGPGGRHAYELCVGLSPDVLARALAAHPPAGGAVAAVIDRTRRVVVRSRLNERFAGTEVIPPVRAAMAAGPEGVVHTETVEGVPSTIVFARALQSGFSVAIGMPDEVYLAPLRRAMARTFAVGAAIAAAGLLVALLMAGRITAALARIADVALGRAPAGPRLRETDALVDALGQAMAARDQALAELQMVLDASPVGVCRADFSGQVYTANDAWLRVMGCSRADLAAGQVRWDERTPPEWLARDQAAMAEALARGKCTPYEKEMRLPGGGRVPVLVAFALLEPEAGQVAAYVVDLTEIHRQRAAIEAERARFALLVSHMPVGVGLFDTTGRVLLDNAAWRACLGADCELIPSRQPPAERAAWVGVHPDGRPIAPQDFPGARALRGEVVDGVEMQHRPADGPARWYRLSALPLRDAAGAVEAAIAVVVDIDATRRAEQQVRESETRLALAQRAAGIGSWEIDLHGGRIVASPEAYQVWGIAPDSELTQARFVARVHPEDRPGFIAAWTLADTRGVASDIIFRIVTDDGGERWLSAIGEAVRDEAGRALRVIGVIQDITARKRYELELLRLNAELEARVTARTAALSDAARELTAEMRRREQAQASLLQSQKMEALGRLTGGIAHDMNNVLAAVVGHYELIQNRSTDPRVRSCAEKGLEAAERATALVRRLVAFARQEDLRPVTVQLPALFQGLVDILPHSVGQRVRVAFEVPAETWPILADARALEVALINLLVNARDAMPEGGVVQVTAANVTDAPAVPAALRAGGCVAIRVRDHGTGMPPEVLVRATEPFFTTKPRGKGTGMGLAMVDGLVAQLGGVMRIDSRPGEGTCVELLLPRAAADFAAAEAGTAAPEEGQHGEAAILLVDDDEQVRTVTASFLRDLGYTVIEAGTAEAAYTLAMTLDVLDLVVTDVVMPGADGTTLAARLRADLPGLPILFMTGRAPDLEALRGEVVLRKPFKAQELARAVLVQLGREAMIEV